MSTIQSSAEHLTLNADGSSKDIKFQVNGVEKASISSSGAFTSTTIDATKLTGNLPAISGAALTGVGVAGITSAADATAIKIDSSERVAIGNTDAGNYSTSADNLVVYDATQHAGITIASGGSNKTGNIYFADGTSGDAEAEGYIEYNHLTNALNVGANHATALSIDSTGRVTIPNQPSFAAFRSSGTWNASVSDILIHNGEDYDIGNNHNTTTGKFTAPVAGKYLISFWAMTNDDAAYIDHYVAIRINGTHHKRIYSSSRAADHHQWSWSGVISLAANDYVDIGGGDVKFYGSDGYYSHFGGHLLG